MEFNSTRLQGKAEIVGGVGKGTRAKAVAMAKVLPKKGILPLAVPLLHGTAFSTTKSVKLRALIATHSIAYRNHQVASEQNDDTQKQTPRYFSEKKAFTLMASNNHCYVTRSCMPQ
jgi:hypothetical protein